VASYQSVDGRFPHFTRPDGTKQLLVPVPRCELCFKPIPEGFEKSTGKCYDCYTGSPIDGDTLERVIAATLYVPRVTGYPHSQEIRKLKDGGAFAEQYAHVLMHVCQTEGVKLGRGGVLVPIPRTTALPSMSGPDALAAELSKLSGVPVRKALSFNRVVQRQRGLSPTDRRKNMENSMDCDSSVKGRPVFLIDDVLTTGHTMREGARAAREGGANSVIGLVAGRDSAIEYLVFVGVMTVVPE
jgi:predicted amidophosphoribosyltransferase